MSSLHAPLPLEAFLTAEKSRGPFSRGPERNALDEAKSESRERGYAEGLQKGHEDGSRAGYEAAYRETKERLESELQSQIDGFIRELQAKIDGFNRALPAFLDDAEQAMASRAMEVITSLLSQELSTDRTSVMAIVREVLGEITMARHARIRVNPFDAPLLLERKAQIMLAAASLRDVDILEDATITGGCVVETDTGILDASLDTRLADLTTAYREAA